MLFSDGQLPSALYTAQAIREAEARMIASGEASLCELIDKAGQSAFELLQREGKLNNKILVLAGYGNNGADAYICATLLLESGCDVSLYAVERTELGEGVNYAKAAFLAAGGHQLTDYKDALKEAEVVIDGLLGTGVKGEVRAPFVDIITLMQSYSPWILSLDVPSGIDVDTGAGLLAVRADVTLTFGAPKQGLITGKARDCVGRLWFADIGLQPFLPESKVTNIAYRLTDLGLPARAKNSHKGACGKVTVIGGDFGMAGAPRLAAESCLRAGAGLVAVISRPEHLTVVNAGRPEIMFWGCELVDMEVYQRLGWADILLIGPGLGKRDWGYNLLKATGLSDKPCVMDADALNLLALEPTKQSNWVLTPHSGEAARLLGISIAEVEADRFAAVYKLQAKYGGVVVLKGAGTLIYDGKNCHVAPVGNPGLASGGSGDVLGGIIAALMAQGMPMMDAASAGVVVHGVAADFAAEKGERGMLACDLFEHIRALVDKI
ncbi:MULTISPECIES: bifunctional ADP-dependent NAD(P)H-hydrate dehydratase/NAD(P)H-hydrate epimerase [Shewanella]|uniref:Bifunctional NAD(P)H-hydrate repair enzyme n=1 Tax=Shewanella marisflavi TaxID=260364 RepID=A0ABX5WIB6_9GAMM|nr:MULTISPECIES: bifunctional ADP-dependent NAD(P)H-hydrate dehydratase/NAD(P)H-hydrate epimerase [Shewanella]QDF74144.1 bifunctional ADP-dependent NAD(P)H-hydrate dehydratase/NAD(P)H-hydrate epimerase [Shewanella marisflavi]